MAIVGIDLGTTNSLIAVWAADKPEILENSLGEELTPSVVSMSNEMALVGQPAADRLITHPEHTQASFKRFMGTTTSLKAGDKTFRPEELSALVLRSLVEDAEAVLGEKIDEAIISVPAYFNDIQRKATLDAAALAGLKVERLINEPTAAALAYGLQSAAEGQFLILDLGGGTFDVSLLHKYEGVMEVRASAGDTALGGNDFRECIETLIVQKSRLERAQFERQDEARLVSLADRIKHRLTSEDSADYKLQLGADEYSGVITRIEFEQAAQPLINRLRIPVERAIKDANVVPKDIDQIILVGGGSRMPLVRQLVTRLFGRFPMLHPRPDHVIALGAAVQAGLKSRSTALEDIVMTDVCPFSLSTSVFDQYSPEGAVCDVIIQRNASVPISAERYYSTTQDKQKQVDIQVLQGEGMRPSQNVLLGEVKMAVPPAPAGKESIAIRYTYDINGALEVEVKVLSTKAVKREIFRNQANLSMGEIEERFRNLSKIKLPPREQAENHALIAKAERLYTESLGTDREHIMHLLRQFEREIIETQNHARLKEIRQRFSADLAQFNRQMF